MATIRAFDLQGFYRGEREILTGVYRDHVGRVERAVTRYCRGADAESVIHDVFLGVIERPEVRRQFTGGDLGAWLATIGARRAIDHLRRERRWTALDGPCSLDGALAPVEPEESLLHRDQVRHLKAALARFRQQELPRVNEKLAAVFRVRFEEHRSQSEAAAHLKLPRTTVIDREQRLLKIMRRYFRKHFKE